MIHTANITTEPGFKRFAKQKEASVSAGGCGGRCWMMIDLGSRVLLHFAGHHPHTGEERRYLMTWRPIALASHLCSL